MFYFIDYIPGFGEIFDLHHIFFVSDKIADDGGYQRLNYAHNCLNIRLNNEE